MKFLETYIPPDPLLIEMVIAIRKWKPIRQKDILNFKEDFSKVSSKYPIFSIADGVVETIKEGTAYPIPSGASEVAKLFCETAISVAEKKFDVFSSAHILEVFQMANEKIRKYNTQHGLTQETINYLDKDYYSCAAAFGLIKENKFYWGSIVDSQVAVFSKIGQLKFLSDDGWEEYRKHAPKDLATKPRNERMFYQHTHRNIVAADGSLLGYGVLSGEENAIKYLKNGVIGLEEGDIIFAVTDGMSPYLEQEPFIRIFQNWSSGIEDEVTTYIANYVDKNEGKEELYKFLYEYATERTLVAVRN